MSNLDLSDRLTLAKAIHQLYNTENKAERDALQQQLEQLGKFSI
jgi:hypothetical protein